MNNTEIIIPTGGLNTDDSKHTLPVGDTDYRVNMIPDSKGNGNVLSAIRGNRNITTPEDSEDDVATEIQTIFELSEPDYYHFGVLGRNPTNGKYLALHRLGLDHVGGGSDGAMMKTISNDGQVWTLDETPVVTDASYDVRQYAGGYDSNGRFHCFYCRYDGAAWADLLYIYSDSNGQTWSSPATIMTFTWPNDAFWPANRIIELTNGDLVVGGHGRTPNGGTYDNYIGIIRSEDGGATWSIESVENTTSTYNYVEPSIVETENNKILMVVRKTATGENSCYRQFYYNGATWTNQGDTSFEKWTIDSSRERPPFIDIITYNGAKIAVCYFVNSQTFKFKSVYGLLSDAPDGPSMWNINTVTDIMDVYEYDGNGFTRDGYQSSIHIDGEWGGMGQVYLEPSVNKSDIVFFNTPRSNLSIVVNALGISGDFTSGTVVGDCYDSKRNCQYIFHKAESGYHNIYKYDYATGVASLLIKNNNKLGFDVLMPDACVIGDYLFFNPRTSSPRAVNVEWANNYQTYRLVDVATNYTTSSADINVYGKIMEVIASATGAEIIADVEDGEYKKVRPTGKIAYYTTDLYFYNYTEQPLYKPVAEYGDDADRDVNNVSKGMFQFCYRYILHDGSTSITSPYSDIAVPYGSSENQGGEGLLRSANNKIIITVTLPSNFNLSFASINFIEILFRTTDATGWTSWKMADNIQWEDIITAKDDGSIDYDFYNDRSYDITSQDEVARVYSNLPVTSNCQEGLLDNRIAYGGITEGMDNILPVVTLTPQEHITSITGTGGGVGVSYEIIETGKMGSWKYTSQIITVLPGEGSVVEIVINGVTTYYTVDDTDVDIPTYISHLAMFIFTNYPGATSVYYTTNYFYVTFSTRRTFVITVYSTAGSVSFYKMRGFKTGATHQFCKFYYDALGRRSNALVSEDTKVFLPNISDWDVALADAEKIYSYTIDWEDNSAPPDDAVYWRWGYAGNSTMTWFIQTEITAFTLDDSGYTTIDITSWAETYRTTYPNTTIPEYTFHQGDRVRILTTEPTGPPNKYPSYNVLYDDEIIDYAENKLKLYQMVSPVIAGAGIVEIYRPQKTDDINYYEYGSLYEIYEDGGVRYHRGQLQDQTASQGATGTFVGGDIFHITRATTENASLMFPMESMAASDFYDSSIWGEGGDFPIGKAGFVSAIGKTTLNKIVWSDSLIQDTKVNGLSSIQYDGTNVKTVPNKFGQITGMREIGHVLRVYLESNTVSFGVGRTEWDDASGQYMSIPSSNVLGVMRVEENGYGTIFPESITKVGRLVYFFDSRKGVFVRDTVQGAYPISGKYMSENGIVDYKMSKFFNDKKNSISTSGESNCSVMTGYDPDKQLLVVAFNDSYNFTNSCVICFHEPTNRWVTFLMEDNQVTPWDFPGYISKEGNFMFSYLDGIWLHDDSADYCKFYDNQYGVETRVYSDKGNGVNKLYEAVGVESNQQLSLDTIYVYTDETVLKYMLSAITGRWWKKIEGIWRAPFLRNRLSDGVSSKKNLFNGDFLRGRVIELRLTKDSVTTDLSLYKVEITTDKSNI